MTSGPQPLPREQVAVARKIVHRDIKPQNILMDDKGAVKVLDFGLAKATQAAEYSSLTMSGQVMGTPSFTADDRTDLYAVGAVLYFCITGGLPHSGKTAMEIVRQARQGVPEAVQAEQEDARQAGGGDPDGDGCRAGSAILLGRGLLHRAFQGKIGTACRSLTSDKKVLDFRWIHEKMSAAATTFISEVIERKL